ncbi:uncharacterized protein LOC105700161 [Orussus abietinus]|uniref:uncharacterized protein LOC105700161 n=1 Tax=Orussus abietinus TaxID=222816 RepID=UPI000625C3E1|nr:uncharacterized protein LOC105700161 [Orussus abietinus]XP_012281232.1 uncharacterized protein LOC105700161 [Orussus abietinus]XP_023289554.1 uncharacterized protein LOC105700161 [Orussus abietinus]
MNDMSYDKYFEVQNDGCYCLHFPNKFGLSVDEIKEIFSEFGTVQRVNCAGDDFGFRFVRYATREEAVRCLDGLRGHSKVKLLPCIDKSKKGGRQGHKGSPSLKSDTGTDYSNQSDSDSQKNGTSKKNRGFQQDEHGSQSRNPFHRNGGSRHAYNKLRHNDEDFDEMNSKDSSSAPMSWNPSLYEKKENIPKEPVETSLVQLMKLHNLRGTNANTFKRPGFSNDAVDDSKTMQECNNVQPDINAGNFPPPLISIDKPSSLERIFNQRTSTPNTNVVGKQIKIIPSGEVIVANIPPNLSVHYIMHILEMYEPICISAVMTVPHLSLRYCHVYFKLTQVAQQVQKIFDNHEISGHKLIVLTPESLETEAYLP